MISKLKKKDGLIFLIGFISFVLGYNFFKPVEIDSIYTAVVVTLVVAFFFYLLIYLLMKFRKMRLFWIFVVLMFLTKTTQSYFDPEAVERLKWLKYTYFVTSLFIVTVYWIRHTCKKLK